MLHIETGYNLEDYETARESFGWEDIYAEAEWDAPEWMNVGHEVCDRHVAGGDRIALRRVGVDGESRTLTFEELAERSNRFANVLADLGVERGERVFSYMPRIPDHYVALVGTLKHGAVFGGINERFGPDGISLSAHEYPRKVEFRSELPKTVTGKIRRTELQDDAAEEADETT